MHQANIPPNVDLDHLGEFIQETSLDLYQMFGDGNIESAAEVDIWKKKFVLGQSLYNPQALSDLGDANVPAKQVVHAGVYRWILLRWCQN